MEIVMYALIGIGVILSVIRLIQIGEFQMAVEENPAFQLFDEDKLKKVKEEFIMDLKIPLIFFAAAIFIKIMLM